MSSFSNLSVTSSTLSSFSNPSVALPKSQLILHPFRCFTYVTAHSPTLLSLLLPHRLFNYVTWRAAHGKNGNTVHSEAWEVIINSSIQEITCRRTHVFLTDDITLILSISLAPINDAIVNQHIDMKLLSNEKYRYSLNSVTSNSPKYSVSVSEAVQNETD